MRRKPINEGARADAPPRVRRGRPFGLVALLAGLSLVVWLDERRRDRRRWLGRDSGPSA